MDYNKFLSLVNRRKSVRNFTSQKVSDEILTHIIEAARLAPSAVNFQPWHFVVVRTSEAMSRLQTVYNREWFKTAPACIAVCGNHNESWHRASDSKDHCDIDIAIAAEHICLAATAMGLGSCWVCNFDTETCKQILGLPEGIEPIVLLPIGYFTDETHSEKKRKSLEEIVTWQ